jgi:hypothetical protein
MTLLIRPGILVGSYDWFPFFGFGRPSSQGFRKQVIALFDTPEERGSE